jgi:hypothetical protein
MNMRKLGRRLGSLGNKRKATGGTTLVISQANAPDVISEGETTRKQKYTRSIDIWGVGTSADGERFLEVAVGSETALLNVDNISGRDSPELKKLTRLGEPLIKPAARSEFLDRAHVVAREKPSFTVAKMTGYQDDRFILPAGLAPNGETDVRRAFDYRYAPYHKRLCTGGSPKSWLKSVELCRGKSRLITGLCLMLSGPVCGKFGDEPPGIGLTSKGGMGGTTIGRFVSTVWGGDHNPSRKAGCGVSWNHTGLNVEVLLGAFNQMGAYFDDLHNAGEAELKALQNGMNGEGRGRSTDAQRAEFSTPLWSSSNASIIGTAVELKRLHLIIPLIDRFAEMGVPTGCPYFFEGISTPKEMRTFGGKIRQAARTDFGWAGPEFQRRLDAWVEKDEAAARSFVNRRHDIYHAAADAIASASERDLGRISNRFATVYLTGCLASALKILPFTEAEILEAVLTCHRDHVAYVDERMAAHGLRFDAVAGVTRATQAPTSTESRTSFAGPAKPGKLPFERIKRLVNAGRKGGFHDLDRIGAKKSFVATPLGYKKMQGRGKSRHIEFLIPDATFEGEAGGWDEANALKHDFHQRGLLIATRRGNGFCYVVKRTLPDGSRPNFVILRYAEKPKAT